MELVTVCPNMLTLNESDRKTVSELLTKFINASPHVVTG
jgi:hypothetical protein